MRSLSGAAPTAFRAAVAAVLFVGVSACSADAGAPAAGESADSPYGYGPEAMIECLEDNGVQVRVSEDGNQVEVVNPGEPGVAEASARCARLTEAPPVGGSTAFGNAVTQAIAECLGDRGYDVSIGVDPELGGQDGSDVLTYSVPVAQRETPGYPQDENDCVAAAEATIPSPTG